MVFFRVGERMGTQGKPPHRPSMCLVPWVGGFLATASDSHKKVPGADCLASEGGEGQADE